MLVHVPDATTTGGAAALARLAARFAGLISGARFVLALA